MKDTELRAIVLNWYYEKRRDVMVMPDAHAFNPPLLGRDLYAICGQLGENGLLNWKQVLGIGKITAAGIDAVESQGASSALPMSFQAGPQFTFNGQANVQVGNQNTQSIVQTFETMIERIDSSAATPEDKAEAKSRLASFLSHPLVISVAGGVAQGLVSKLSGP